MNEFEDIDRELNDAFAQRPSTLSRPSLRDVKHRARRHQRQRSAGVLSACAVVAVGGAAVLATRSPANHVSVGGGAGDATTIPGCYNTTEPPVSTIGFASTIEVFDSSNPPSTTFNTLPFPPYTGPATTLPPISEPTAYTTIPDPLSTVVAFLAPSVDPCSPRTPNRYRCAGDPVQGGDGWWYFDYCEASGATNTTYPPTTSVVKQRIRRKQRH